MIRLTNWLMESTGLALMTWALHQENIRGWTLNITMRPGMKMLCLLHFSLGIKSHAAWLRYLEICFRIGQKGTKVLGNMGENRGWMVSYYTLSCLLWRHQSGCNQDFPYFPQICQYSTLVPFSTESIYLCYISHGLIITVHHLILTIWLLL